MQWKMQVHAHDQLILTHCIVIKISIMIHDGGGISTCRHAKLAIGNGLRAEFVRNRVHGDTKSTLVLNWY